MKGVDIIWVKNRDGSYKFTNNGGVENSIYAWYILDGDGQVIYRTGYSESPHFVFDLKGNRQLVIKGFVRTKTEENYRQTSAKVNADEILGKIKYEVVSTEMPENAVSVIRRQYVENSSPSLPEKCILMKDGSLWKVNLAIPVDWNCPNIENRSYGFWVNGFMFLDETYKAYYSTHNKIYAKAIIDYVIDWAKQNTQYNNREAWAWHDHATARRVLRMSLYYYELKELCSGEEREQIEKSLRYQAELLATDEFYKAKHNHGMHQDIALLVYALLLGDKDRKEYYVSTAINRTGEYLDYVYTEEGIHKEHSPYYARDTFGEVAFLKKFLENISPDFSRHMKEYMDGAQKYMIQLIKPDGMWPSLGDSAKADGTEAIGEVSMFEAENNREYLWITSGGLDGVIPENAYIAPGGGVCDTSFFLER